MKAKPSSLLPFLIFSFLFLAVLPSCSDNSNKSLPAREYNGEWVEGAMSRLVIDHLLAKYNRTKELKDGTLFIPQLPGTPAAIEEEISKGFIKQARYLTGGLVDHLRGMSYWKDPVNPEILKIAKQAALIK